MTKYQIVGKRVKLSDERFDNYLDESLSFFSKLESIAGSPPPITLEDTKGSTDWRNRRWKDISEAIANCRHKIQALNYGISLIDSEIQNPPIPHNRSLPIHLDETEFLDDVVLFEFESFLLQVMSTLDVFVHLLRLFYPCLDSENENEIGFKGRKGRAGKRTVESLKTENTQLADYIDRQVEAWIQRIYELRNIAAHQSKVHNLQMFLIDGKGIHLPKLSDDGSDLLTYCKDTYKNVKTFLFDIEDGFLLPEAEHFYEMK